MDEVKNQDTRTAEFSRRTLIAAGWTVPVVLAVGLSTPAKASPGHSDHTDAHTDVHTDTTAPGGGPHVDSHTDSGLKGGKAGQADR
jgi:hypothetical protein